MGDSNADENGEGVAPAADTVVEYVDEDPPKLESQLALARARERLLGRSTPPSTMGRYEIRERLGSGGMGIVYAARDPDLDRIVAVKVLRSRLMPDSQGRSRMVREAQALAKLNHPNVVHVYEVGRSQNQLFIAMEFVRGRTLSKWVEQESPTLGEILTKYVDAGRGLLAAHRAGVVHRDFKPDNVLVGDDGRVRVMDFGLARPSVEGDTLTEMMVPDGAADTEHTPESMTKTGTVMGTPAYMDPQQLLGTTADAASDQYAFCVSLYESLFGKRPFIGATVTELFNTMRSRKRDAIEFPGRVATKPLQALLRRGLAYERDDRFETFAALLEALESAHAPTRRRWAGWLLPVVATVGIGAAAFTMRPEPEAAVEQAAVPEDARAKVVAETDLPPTVETPLPDDPMGTTVHRLDNGLTIYLVPRPKDPTVSVQVVVRAGPSDEPDDARGIAALLADSVGSGTLQLGVRDAEAEAPLLAKQHEALSALPNAESEEERAKLLQAAHDAHTESLPVIAVRDMDYLGKEFGIRYQSAHLDLGTVFESELPPGALEGWLELNAEILSRPAFRGLVLQTQGALETLAWLYQTSLHRQALMARVARAYGASQEVEKDYASLKQVPFEAIRAMHETYYRPNNTAVVLVGNVSPESTLPLVEQAFGDWEPAPLPPPALLRDEPLPDAGTRFELDAPASEAVWVGVSLPPANDGSRSDIEAFVSLLSGPNGLLQASTEGSAVLEDPWAMLDGRMLVLGAAPVGTPNPGEIEAELIRALESIAAGEVDVEAWDLAAARLQLDAASWDRSPVHLAGRISSSFLLHRDWADVVSGHDGVDPTRSALESVASELLARDRVVMQVTPGPGWMPENPGLPVELHWDSANIDPAPSPYARALTDKPRPDIEPRFLSEGLHFDMVAWGDAKVVTHESNGALFWVDLVYPVGVLHDPFVCDAARLRAHRWQEDGALAELDLEVWCAADTTTIALSGVADTFDRTWDQLWKHLDQTTLPESMVKEVVADTVHRRRENRRVPHRLEDALIDYVREGEAGLQQHMPSDEDLLSASPSRFETSLRLLAGTTPDVAYAGPNPERLREQLPAARGVRPGPVQLSASEREEHTFYVLDFPGTERVNAQFIMPWIVDTPLDATLVDIFEEEPGPGFRDAPKFGAVPYASGADGFDGLIRPPYAWGLEVSHDGLADLLALAVEDYVAGPESRWFERARARVETSYRHHRFLGIEIPRYVLRWPEGVEPRLGRWSQLGRATAEMLEEYARRISARSLAVSMVGDVSRLDMDKLEALGRVVIVQPEQVLRDVHGRRPPTF